MRTRPPVVLRWDQLAPALRVALASRQIAVLILRRPKKALTRATVRAFALAAERVMREGDALAHDPGSDCFALAMLAPARDGAASQMLDARAALERIAAALPLQSGERLEMGWWPLTRSDEIDDFRATSERALERGARERERFEFLATVGHELRTPLTSIRGYVETLLDEQVDPGTARRFLEIVRSEALRLGRLVDGMLEFSLLDLSSDARSGVTDLADVIAAAVEALAPVAAQAGIAVHAQVERDAFARIGVDACMHAVLNILENAVKYGRPGGRVMIKDERQDAFICIVVDDDGPGIDRDDRERIFARLARGARTGDRRGCGIGLTIVRTIVERAGGSVRATASPLGGARFIVRLPRIVAMKEELAAQLS